MKRLNSNRFLVTIVLTSVLAFLCSNNDDNNMDIGNTNSTTIYASNNSNGNMTIYDVTDATSITTKSLITTSTATDAVIQASRSGLGLEGFTNISDLLTNTSINADLNGTNDMSSPREVAVNGNTYVVADNADADGNTDTPDGKLFIYTRSGNSFTLRNTITTDFKLWGITFDGDDLYAVVDATNELAIYTDFYLIQAMLL